MKMSPLVRSKYVKANNCGGLHGMLLICGFKFRESNAHLLVPTTLPMKPLAAPASSKTATTHSEDLPASDIIGKALSNFDLTPSF